MSGLLKPLVEVASRVGRVSRVEVRGGYDGGKVPAERSSQPCSGKKGEIGKVSDVQ